MINKALDQKIRNFLEKNLPGVFQESQLKKVLGALQIEWKFSESTKVRMLNQAHKIDLKWSKPPHLSMMTYLKEVDDMDLICGFCSDKTKYYVSHYNAFYFHGWVTQKPSTYYLSKEIPGRSSLHSSIYNSDLVKQAFMKDWRHSNRFAKFKNLKFFILEKQDLKMLGIIKKTIRVEERTLTFNLSDMERTLIESVISPHYSGGILTVFNAFKKAKIDLIKLKEIYQKLNLFYPYWQIIGFILEKNKGPDMAQKWGSYFSEDQKEFYIDKKFRQDWEFNKEWKIYYPKGLIRDQN